MLRLAEKMSRLGTETAFDVLARAETLTKEGRDIIYLGIGHAVARHSTPTRISSSGSCDLPRG